MAYLTKEELLKYKDEVLNGDPLLEAYMSDIPVKVMVDSEQVLKDLNDLIAVQQNDNETDDYMRGLYNGLVLARALITEEEPVYE